MKKILIISLGVVSLCSFFFYEKDAKVLLYDDVEALSACEASFENESGQTVHVECVGEKGTCTLHVKQKVKTKYGTYTVDATITCSGEEKS